VSALLAFAWQDAAYFASSSARKINRKLQTITDERNH